MRLRSLTHRSTRKRFRHHIAAHKTLKPLSHHASAANKPVFEFSVDGSDDRTYQIEFSLEDVKTLLMFITERTNTPPTSLLYGILTDPHQTVDEFERY